MSAYVVPHGGCSFEAQAFRPVQPTSAGASASAPLPIHLTQNKDLQCGATVQKERLARPLTMFAVLQEVPSSDTAGVPVLQLRPLTERILCFRAAWTATRG